jgi:hypothetical protein
MTFLRVLLALALAGFASGAHAADDGAPVFHGDYYFYTFQEKDGRPVCSETWRFADDGTQTIRSGEEIATQRFRTAPGRKNTTLLFLTFVSSNGKPDCENALNRDAPKDQEWRILGYKAADGGIVLCREGSVGSTPVLTPIGHLYAARPD